MPRRSERESGIVKRFLNGPARQPITWKGGKRAGLSTAYSSTHDTGGFFQLGIDHESTTPQFGKRKRPILVPEALPRLIDGEGGILPAILLSSKIQWNGDGFDELEEVAVQEVKRTLRMILKTVLGEVDMEKLQKHLDEQAKKAIQQATRRMLKNETAEDIVAGEVAGRARTLEKAMRAALASGKLAEFLASLSPEEKEQFRKALG